MFTKLKNFSEDVAKSFNDINHDGTNGNVHTPSRLKNPINELKNESKVLNTKTPDAKDLTQPEDEPISKSLSPSLADNKTDPTKNQTIDLAELPPSIRSKMKKFAKYEEKYPILLEAFKTEKRKAELTVSFEKVLQENTPISSISDAGLLVEYLNGINEKTTMLNEEMRKYAKENSILNEKLKDVEIRLKEALEKDKEPENEGISSQDSNDEIEKLRNTISDLKEKLEKKQAEDKPVEEKGRENEKEEETDDRQTKQSEEVDGYKKDIESYKKEIESVKDKLKKSEFSSRNIKDELSAAIEKSNSLEKDLKKLNDTSENDNETTGLKTKLEEYKKQVAELEDVNNTLETEIENKNMELERFKDKSGAIQNDLNNTNKSIETLNSEAQVLNERASDLSNQLDEKNKIIKELEQNQFNAGQEIEVTTPATPSSNNKKNKKKNKKGGKKTSTAEKQITMNKEAEQGLSAESEDMRNKYDELKKENERIQSCLKEIDSSKQEISDELKRTKEKYDKLVQEHDELITNHKKAKSDLKLKIEDVDHLRDLLKTIGDDLVQARDEIKELKEKSKSVKLNNDGGLKKELTEMQAKFKELNKSKEDIEKSKEELLKSIEDNNSSNEESLNTVRDEKQKLENSLRELTKDLKASKEKNSDLENEIGKHLKSIEDNDLSQRLNKGDYDALNKKHSALTSKFEDTNKQFEIVKQEKNDLNKRIKELSEFKSNDSSLKLEIASLKTSISHKDQLIEDFKKKIDALNKLNEELSGSISKLKTSNNELQNSNKDLVSEKNTLVTKQELSFEKNNSLNNELLKLQSEKQKLSTELETMKDKHDSLVKDKTSSSNSIQTFRQQYEELSMKSKESLLRIDNLEDELNESRTMLQERTRESSTIRRMLVDAEEQLKLKNHDFKSELTKISKEKSEIENNCQALIKKKQREIDEFKSITDNYLLKIQDLENKCNELKQQYEELESEKLKDKNTISDKDENFEETQQTIETLRNSLQASSKKVKDFENLNNILKKLNEESNLKFERLSKNYKILTQQYKQIKSSNDSPIQSHAQSSESLTKSPSTSSRHSADDSSSESSNQTNVAYLKNVLLGFFEHKDQRDQLLPVVKTLFNLSSDDEKKFLLALK